MGPFFLSAAVAFRCHADLLHQNSFRSRRRQADCPPKSLDGLAMREPMFYALQFRPALLRNLAVEVYFWFIRYVHCCPPILAVWGHSPE
jgi:hypothetical protein